MKELNKKNDKELEKELRARSESLREFRFGIAGSKLKNVHDGRPFRNEIEPPSIVKIADNTGGKIGRIFKVLGSSKKRYAELGEVVVLSIQKAEPRKAVKKKDVLHAVVVRQRNPYRRKDGSYIRFDENAVVIIEKGKRDPIAGRVFGPIPREIQEAGFQKIASLAPEIV